MLSYPEDSVGAWMNPAPLSALPENTVGEILINMHEAKKFVSDKLFTLYVVDINNNFKGMLSISDLLQVNSQSPLQRVMQRKIKILTPHNSLSSISSLKEWQDFPSLPVIDPDRGLIGELSQTNLKRAQASIKSQGKEPRLEVSNPLWGNLEAVDAFFSGLFEFLPLKKGRD
jgi:magnesium transporter